MVRVVTKELLGASTRDPKSFKWIMFKEGMMGLPARGTLVISVSDFEQKLIEVIEKIKVEDSGLSGLDALAAR